MFLLLLSSSKDNTNCFCNVLRRRTTQTPMIMEILYKLLLMCAMLFAYISIEPRINYCCSSFTNYYYQAISSRPQLQDLTESGLPPWLSRGGPGSSGTGNPAPPDASFQSDGRVTSAGHPHKYQVPKCKHHERMK